MSVQYPAFAYGSGVIRKGGVMHPHVTGQKPGLVLMLLCNRLFNGRAMLWVYFGSNKCTLGILWEHSRYNLCKILLGILYFLVQFPQKLFFFEFGNAKVTVHKCVESIQGRKLCEEIRYSKALRCTNFGE